MVENPYFQFQLCALSFGADVTHRLNAIIDYSTIAAGMKWWNASSVNQQQEFASQTEQLQKSLQGFNRQVPLHWGALYGGDTIGLIYGNFLAAIKRYEQLQAHIAAFEARHGPDAKVRIKKDWLFDARDGHGISYREFAVLCGIYSAISDKEMAIVTRARVQRRALGYRSSKIMDAELPNRIDKAQPLTERQLRDTISCLHRNRFFARCTFARRITYYSIRLDGEALREKVLDRRTYAQAFHASEAAQDQALTAAIKQRRALRTA